MLVQVVVGLMLLAASAFGQRAAGTRQATVAIVRGDGECAAQGLPAFSAASRVNEPNAGPGFYLGVWQPGVPEEMERLDAFMRDAGVAPAIVMLWNDWASAGTLDTADLCAIAARGAVPLITWMPTDWRQGVDRSGYSLNSILSGRLDGYLRGWAQQLAAYSGPVLLRFAHEMNGTWYGWGRRDGNTPVQYIRAWQHVHDLFVAEGATNVQWVWCPNVADDATSRFEPYYPGDDYVDWVALDGYNRGPEVWRWFTPIFGPSYAALTALTDKPVMIAEVGTSEALPQQAAQGDTKARWITSALTEEIPDRFPAIRAVVWFNEDKHGQEGGGYDWRIESSEAAQQAFAQAVASAGVWSSWP
ncbi:MAG TPA: glycosyl hydrolase [Dehalococcoidia bacterium]|nr:glycosyl hydrolase [Dehalococcoidia bacterium]